MGEAKSVFVGSLFIFKGFFVLLAAELAEFAEFAEFNESQFDEIDDDD